MLNMPKKKVAIIASISCLFLIILYKIFSNDTGEIVLNGNVEVQDVDISFRVSGRVAEILADEGNEVKKGSIIATLDSDIFETKAKIANAKMEEAKMSLKNAEKNYIRNKDLYKKKSIPEKIYDSANTEYGIAKAQLESAQASLELAKIELHDTKLRSTADGIVLTRNIECGEMINAGLPAYTIMPHIQTKIKTYATEAVLSRIKYGDIVYINNEAERNKKYRGHIGYIAHEAEFTPRNIETKELRATLMYRIRVIVDEPAPALKQGMPVTISYNK
jgi:HlyD family secretion protein